jgi:hypothetical protein
MNSEYSVCRPESLISRRPAAIPTAIHPVIASADVSAEGPNPDSPSGPKAPPANSARTSKATNRIPIAMPSPSPRLCGDVACSVAAEDDAQQAEQHEKCRCGRRPRRIVTAQQLQHVHIGHGCRGGDECRARPGPSDAHSRPGGPRQGRVDDARGEERLNDDEADARGDRRAVDLHECRRHRSSGSRFRRRARSHREPLRPTADGERARRRRSTSRRRAWTVRECHRFLAPG